MSLILAAGVCVWAALPASDSFNRADANPLGPASGGNTWSGLENNMRVVSNQAKGATGGAQNTIFDNSDTFGNDQFSQITIIAAQDGGPVVRASAGPNYYWFEGKLTGSNNTNLKKNVAGSVTTLQSGLSCCAANDIVKLTVTSSTIQLYKNAVQLGTDQSDSSLASGAAGFGSFDVNTIFDTWSADNNGGVVSPHFLTLVGVGN